MGQIGGKPLRELTAGQRFTPLVRGDVGHGTISRRVFTENSPS